jgi:hypothetical protein
VFTGGEKSKIFLPLSSLTVPDAIFRLLLLLRFIFFMALVYLALHTLFSRLISTRDSKILSFFSILTGPLTRPIRAWIPPDAPESRLRFVALAFYGLLWAIATVVTELLAVRSP